MVANAWAKGRKEARDGGNKERIGLGMCAGGREGVTEEGKRVMKRGVRWEGGMKGAREVETEGTTNGGERLENVGMCYCHVKVLI